MGSAQGDSLWIFTCDGANSQNWNLSADSPVTEAASAANGLQLMYNQNTGLFDNNCGDTNYLTLAENLFYNINQNGWDGGTGPLLLLGG